MRSDTIQLIFEKENEVKYIINSYDETKKIVLQNYNEFFERARKKENVDQLLRDNGEQLTKLNLLYQDFFIHGIILLDLISIYLSNGEQRRFSSDGVQRKHPSLVESCESNEKPFTEPILAFKPYGERMRYYRNKFFAHKEVIHNSHPVRFSIEQGKFEFALIDFHKKVDKTDYDELIKLRDEYSPIYCGLQGQNNFWEMLKLFNELPIILSEEEGCILLKLHKKYGSFLPELEFYIPPFNAFLREVRQYLK